MIGLEGQSENHSPLEEVEASRIRRHALWKSEQEWVFRAGSISTETGKDQILSSSFIGPWS